MKSESESEEAPPKIKPVKIVKKLQAKLTKALVVRSAAQKKENVKAQATAMLKKPAAGVKLVARAAIGAAPAKGVKRKEVRREDSEPRDSGTAASSSGPNPAPIGGNERAAIGAENRAAIGAENRAAIGAELGSEPSDTTESDDAGPHDENRAKKPFHWVIGRPYDQSTQIGADSTKFASTHNLDGHLRPAAVIKDAEALQAFILQSTERWTAKVGEDWEINGMREFVPALGLTKEASRKAAPP